MVITERDRAAVVAAGRSAFAGFELHSLARVPSTQDVVRSAARGGAAPGFCCVAGEQSAGRGRQGRTWSAPPGSALLCSTLVRMGGGTVSGIPLAAGLATRAALASATGLEARLKWPNDLMAGGRKLAGILCEVEPEAPGTGVAVVIGIGVNLARGAVPAAVEATSIEDETGGPTSAGTVLAALLPELARWLGRLDTEGVPGLRADWMRVAWGIGAGVVARGPTGDITGVAETIDDDGALLLRVGDQLTRVLAADVHLLPRPGP